MAVGRFLLCLHSHMPYVLSHGKSPHGTDWLNESAAECYLPILDALDRLNGQGIKPRWTINMTPILAEQLDDPSFKAGFEEYCQEKIDAAIADGELFRKEGPEGMEGLAAMWQRYYTRALVAFKHQWGRSINEGFRYFQDEGSIELITCGATHGYFPLANTDHSIQAQVKLAVRSHVERFGKNPRGIWLPECAYRPGYDWVGPVDDVEPWPRKSVEDFLYENGIEYFFVDSHMIRGGEPLGTYGTQFPQLADLFERSKKMFTPPDEYRSEYEHYALPNGVICFARDPHTTVKVWSGEVGYPGNEWYLEFHKQFYPGRLRYWRISPNKADLGQKQQYNPWNAYENIQSHAEDFVQLVKSTMQNYKDVAGRTGTLVAMYDTELFGHWWWEGPEFLYEMGRAMAAEPELESVSGGDVIDEEPARHMIHLPEGSWGEGGYHFIWLNNDNLWTWQRLYPAQRKMIELANSCQEGLCKEIAEQAARELLLAEASDWQFLISTWAARDYAEIRIADHMDRFFKLAEMAESALAKGTITAEERSYLEDCKQKDAPFSKTIDLSDWAKLEYPLQQMLIPEK
ncbi:MAG: DUF1957 domain-containing protein [Armatimonadetes bacterium]|nr:DUF1957 domain-containing protein [Armatimonadota bacterium]